MPASVPHWLIVLRRYAAGHLFARTELGKNRLTAIPFGIYVVRTGARQDRALGR